MQSRIMKTHHLIKEGLKESLKPPKYLEDYHCNATKHQCGLVQYKDIHCATNTITSKSEFFEPRYFKEAINIPHWKKAMNKEIQALESNQTWDIVSLPIGKKAIGCKWIFKVKQKAIGTIERYKERLVAKEYNQKYGIDYDETFSPVVKMSTIRCLIATTAHKH